MHVYIFEKNLKSLKKYCCFILIYLFFFVLSWFVFLYCGDTNSVFKIPDFRQDIQDFLKKMFFLLSKNSKRIP